jgi:hypothetical protein
MQKMFIGGILKIESILAKSFRDDIKTQSILGN